MKIAKTLSVLSLITLSSVVTSVQAVELVQVEPIKKVVLTHEVKIDLEQSLKTMQINLVPSVPSAQEMIAKQDKVLTKKADKLLSKAAVIAE